MKAWYKIVFIEAVLFQIWLLVVMPRVGIVFMMMLTNTGGSLAVIFGEFLLGIPFFALVLGMVRLRPVSPLPAGGISVPGANGGGDASAARAGLAHYLNDRPREHLFRAILLFFVFPGYYWIHLTRSFDARLRRLLAALDHGVPLDMALARVPGIASRETLLAATVGQYSGKLAGAMKRLSEGRTTPIWIELAPRLLYPLLLLGAMASNVMFIMIFIIPKFQKIFLEFKMKLPYFTELLIDVSQWCSKYPFVPALLVLLTLGSCQRWLFSSTVRWHLPFLDWLLSDEGTRRIPANARHHARDGQAAQRDSGADAGIDPVACGGADARRGVARRSDAGTAAGRESGPA